MSLTERVIADMASWCREFEGQVARPLDACAVSLLEQRLDDYGRDLCDAAEIDGVEVDADHYGFVCASLAAAQNALARLQMPQHQETPMYALSFRRRPAAGALRRGQRREDTLVTEPAVVVGDPLVSLDAAPVSEAAPLSDVVAVEPQLKTYRAVVSRTITQTAVVEFTAPEGTDTMTMAEALLETIPAEAWVSQPADSWGYIDRIEEVGPAAPAGGDPLADPASAPATLSRVLRRLQRRTAISDVTAVLDELRTQVDAIMAGDLSTQAAIDAAIAAVDAVHRQVSEMTVEGGDVDPDGAIAAEAAITEFLLYLEDQLAALQGMVPVDGGAAAGDGASIFV